MLLDTKISFDTACLVALSAYCRCATNKYFQIIGNIHDIESYFHIIFFSHWGHLAWNGNYELWILNPIATIPIAHGIFDPHFGSGLNSDYTIVLSSGIYNWLYTVGFDNVFELYKFVIICELLALISLPLGKQHLILNYPSTSTYESSTQEK